MTDTPSIAFDGVWKKFRRGEVHDSLRDLVPAVMRRILRRTSHSELGAKEFWALSDVSFKVEPGTALGIIGANGAGKSTVLKTLTRILRPTRGSCHTVGRVGSLIEVAAGFHPDLTGRENVFLQGAIMGMPAELIRRRFDEIVEFSGIEEFLDTPVKRYSSGMNARLGFSIAAHLDPDVLIIDEVLAVGDMKFQAKAFGQIKSLIGSGMPVIIVSHQLERIAELCTRSIQLQQGKVVFDGDPAECISQYVSGVSQVADDEDRPISVESIVIDGSPDLVSGDKVHLNLKVRVSSEERAEFGVRVRAAQTGSVVFATTNGMCDMALPSVGDFDVSMDLQMNVSPGVYSLEPYLVTWIDGAPTFKSAGPVTHVQVQEDPKFFGTNQLNPRMRIATS